MVPLFLFGIVLELPRVQLSGAQSQQVSLGVLSLVLPLTVHAAEVLALETVVV